MKKYLLFASAILAFASCANDSYLGTEDEKHIANGDQAITFGFDIKRATRSEDATAAGLLNNQFVVYAEKNETSGAAPADGNLVFQNYKVFYSATTANTTTSNTDDWEYVGLSWTAAEQGNIITSTTDAQTIKFWDDAASSYTFTAISALPADISNGRVKITKTTSGTNQYAKGYSLTLTKTTESGNDTYPDLTHLYFADRKNIAKGDGYNHSVVTMNFRNVLSHVRVGIYETIPGYRISAITFYNQDGTAKYTDGASTPTDAFGAVCPNHNPSKFEGTLTVTYADNNSGHENQPIVSLSGATAATDLVLGTNFSTLTTTGEESNHKYLGETSTTATYDTADGSDTDTEPDYTAVMPQTASSNLKLKVNYTLYNTITKETINITGKTAEVPAEYLNWKANYKYTYLFKITDDGLNPITFDAAVIEDAVGNAEYITTVSEPSITTFGVTSTGVYSTGKDEYEVGTDIYATVTANGSVVTPSLGTNVNVYVATTNDANFQITEASVAESIAHSGASPKVTCTLINTNPGSNYFTAAPAKATEVPREDGGYISTSGDLTSQPEGWPTGYYTDERCTTAASTYANGTYYQKWTDALKLTGVKNPNNPTYYVIEYIDSTNKTYKVIKVVAN